MTAADILADLEQKARKHGYAISESGQLWLFLLAGRPKTGGVLAYKWGDKKVTRDEALAYLEAQAVKGE